MDITKLSGDELAQVLGREYQRLMACQENLKVIHAELDRRLSVKKEEPVKE